MSFVRRLQLLKGKEKHSFHYPGHKNRLEELGFTRYDLLDTTETFGTDNLLDPKGILEHAMDTCAKVFHSKHSFFGVGGSTMSLYSAMFCGTKREDRILVQRNVHKSVFQGMAIYGLLPEYLPSSFGEEDLVALEKKLEEGGYTLAVLVSPDYYGFLLPLDRLIPLFHRYDVPVVVDEAHGGHMFFSKDLRPYSALEQGADFVVHSVHKTMPGLTGTSLLHINSDRFSYVDVLKSLRYFTTTSPSYPFLASIEVSVDYMNTVGRGQVDRLLQDVDVFWSMVKDLGIEPIYQDVPYDKTKIYLQVPGLTGSEVYHKLYEKFGLAMEFHDTSGVLGVCTVADRLEDLTCLAKALSKIGGRRTYGQVSTMPTLPAPKVVMTLSETLERKKRRLPIGRAIGHVSADNITPYPPGIPLLVGGEEFSTEMVEIVIQLLKDGIMIQGIDKGYVEVIE